MTQANNPEEITLDSDDEDIDHMTVTSSHMTASDNPDEIKLDDSDEETVPAVTHGVTEEGLEWSIEGAHAMNS